MSRVVDSLLKTSAVIMRTGGVNPDDPLNAPQIFDAWRNAKPAHWRQLALQSGLPMLPPVHQRNFLEELEARCAP